MKNSKIDLKKVLAPTDSIAVAVVIIGLLIAIFIEQIEVRLIGVSIAILGVVAFFMMISQRLKDFIDTKIFSRASAPPPDLKITHTKDSQAKRQIIEDLDTSLDKDFDKVKKKDENLKTVPVPKKSKTNLPTVAAKGFDNGDEGFKIVGKNSEKSEIINKKINDQITPKIDIESVSGGSDEISEVRIISKDKSSKVPTQAQADKKISIADMVKSPVSSESVKQNSEQNTDIIKNTTHLPIQEEEIPQEEVDLFNIPEFNNNGEQTYKELADQIPYTKQVEIPAKNKSVSKAPCKKNKVDVPISILMDESVSSQEPRNEFAGFVSRALMVIRSMASTTTAAFFIVNSEKGTLILETFVTDVPDAIIDTPKIQLGNDVVSQIACSGKPEILTEINPSAELDLIPYYKKNVGSSSFIGLPVFYQNSVLGVLCADTNIEDAYDNLTVGFLGHFTKLIAGLVMNYTEKHELQQASRVLDAVTEIRKIIESGYLTIKNIAEAFASSSEEIFEYKTLGMVCFDFADAKWKVYSYRNKYSSNSIEGKEIDIAKTMIGETITRGITLNMTIGEKSPTRVHATEDKMQSAYFVSAPVISMNKIYGAVFIEAASKSNVTSYDIKILESLGDQAGNALEQLHLNQMLHSTSMLDADTGLLNTYAFEQRLIQESNKTLDFGIVLTLCAFKLDSYASFSQDLHRDRYNKVLRTIIEHINRDLKSYDVFGNGENGVFFVALIGMPLAEAQLWAERIRSEIAQTVINIDKKKYSVTICGGVAEHTKMDTAITLMDKSLKALALATKKTNNITIFG